MKRRDAYGRSQQLRRIQEETERSRQLLLQRKELQDQRRMANMQASFQRQQIVEVGAQEGWGEDAWRRQGPQQRDGTRWTGCAHERSKQEDFRQTRWVRSHSSVLLWTAGSSPHCDTVPCVSLPLA